MEEATRTYLWGKALQQSGLKRKADAAVSTAIPLTTTHGGHPLHVQILSYATAKPLEELTTKTKKRRMLSEELHQKIVQPPIPFIPPPFHKLSPRECMTFAQLSGQQTHRALRAMRSFLNSKGLNFLCSDQKLRLAENEMQLPLHIQSIDPIAFRLKDITVPLSMMLADLHSKQQLALHHSDGGALSLQVQLDKGTEITKGLLKVINVHENVQQKNILPIFHYIGKEDYHSIAGLLKPLLTQLEEFALPSALSDCFSSTLKVLGADIKALQITLGLSPSSSSTFPCPHCLISLTGLRSLAGVTKAFSLRSSLLHAADHWDFRWITMETSHSPKSITIAFILLPSSMDFHRCIATSSLECQCYTSVSASATSYSSVYDLSHYHSYSPSIVSPSTSITMKHGGVRRCIDCSLGRSLFTTRYWKPSKRSRSRTHSFVMASSSLTPLPTHISLKYFSCSLMLQTLHCRPFPYPRGDRFPLQAVSFLRHQIS